MTGPKVKELVPHLKYRDLKITLDTYNRIRQAVLQEVALPSEENRLNLVEAMNEITDKSEWVKS